MKEGWVCTMCYPDVVEYGMIAPCYAFAKIDKKYVVVAGQGHKGDEIITFPLKPFPEIPEKAMETRDGKATPAYHRQMRALTAIRDIAMLGPWEAYVFVKACMDLKYRPYRPRIDGFNFTAWLFHRCGELLYKKEGKKWNLLSAATKTKRRRKAWPKGQRGV